MSSDPIPNVIPTPTKHQVAPSQLEGQLPLIDLYSLEELSSSCLTTAEVLQQIREERSEAIISTLQCLPVVQPSNGADDASPSCIELQIPLPLDEQPTDESDYKVG